MPIKKLEEKKKPEDKCTVISCSSRKNEGDILFCRYHREQWYKFMDRLKLRFMVNVPEVMTDRLVQAFQNGKHEDVRVELKEPGQ